MAEETKKTYSSIDDPEVDPPDPPLSSADSEGDGVTDEVRQKLEEAAVEELRRLQKEEE